MVKMKGIALPIETIVIVAVAVLVLVVVAAFFASGTGGSQVSIVRNTALDTGCQNLRSLYGCATGHISGEGDDIVKVTYQEIGQDKPGPHPLGEICGKLNLNEQQCYIRCGCQTERERATTTTVRR